MNYQEKLWNSKIIDMQKQHSNEVFMVNIYTSDSFEYKINVFIIKFINNVNIFMNVLIEFDINSI